MEIAKTEKNGLDLGILIFDVLLGEEGEGTLHVGLETLRRLIGELNGSLKDTNGDFFAGIGGQVEAEVGMGALGGVDIQLLLEVLKETGHQMDVLEHNPVAFLVTNFELVEGNNILTLTQGDLMKVLVGVNTILSGEAFDILNGVGSW